MSQTVTWIGESGRVEYIQLFPAGSDTALEARSLGTESTNRKGRFSATITNNASGNYTATITDTAGNGLADYEVILAGAGGTSQCYDFQPVTVADLVDAAALEAAQALGEHVIVIGSLHVDSTGNDVQVSLLFTKGGVAQTSGSVEITIYDEDGVELDGIAWPLALTHVADGRWATVIDDALKWPPSRVGDAIIVASDGVNTRTQPATVRFIRG